MEISTDHSDSLVQVLSIPFAKQWFLPIVLSPRMEVYRPEGQVLGAGLSLSGQELQGTR